MINVFISIVFACVSFSIFHFNYDINGLNRLLINTPKEIFETSIDLIHSNKDEMFFNKNLLINNLDQYYKPQLEKYIETYNLNYQFYNPEDKSYCIGDKCAAINITLTAELSFNVSYHKTIYYEIRRGLHVQ